MRDAFREGFGLELYPARPAFVLAKRDFREQGRKGEAQEKGCERTLLERRDMSAGFSLLVASMLWRGVDLA